MPETTDIAELPRVDIDDVEILRAGTFEAGGPDGKPVKVTLTVEDIDEIIAGTAALGEVGGFEPAVWIGHGVKDNVGNGGVLLDGPDPEQTTPRLGVPSNLRRKGSRLFADLKGVPRKLAEQLKAGVWPQRSVGLRFGFQWGEATVRAALVHLGLLGAHLPAVKGMAGLHELFAGEPIPHGWPTVDLACDRLVTFAAQTPDDVLAEVDDLAARLTDHTTNRKGADAVSRAARTFAATVRKHVVADGRLLADHQPATEGDRVDLDKLNETLGTAFETEEAALEHLATLKAKSEAKPDDEPDAVEETSEVAEEAVTAAERVSAENDRLRERVKALEKRDAARQRDDLIEAAEKAGKVTPAERAKWVTFSEKRGNEALEEALGLLPKVVEFGEKGHAGPKDEDEAVELSGVQREVLTKWLGREPTDEDAAKFLAARKSHA